MILDFNFDTDVKKTSFTKKKLKYLVVQDYKNLYIKAIFVFGKP